MIKNKNILMLLQSQFPPDIRLEKEIKSLNENGFNVTLFSNKFSHNFNTEVNYCKIVRPSTFSFSNKFNRLINFPIFFNPKLIVKAIQAFKQSKANFIHAHDLPMVPIGILLKKIFKVPLIFDMHENYPEALKVFEKKGPIDRLLKNYNNAKRLEKYCLKKVDIIISVVEENKERLLHEGVAENKLKIVSNSVDIQSFAIKETNQEIIDKYKDRFVLLYSGLVGPERGLETPVKAMRILKDKFPRALLMILGEGKAIPSLKEIVKEKGLEDNVQFLKWVGHENLNTYFTLSDVCIIPQPSNPFINTTIPHKMFEYMCKGKPLLVSDAIPLKRIITETKAGEYFESNNPNSFSESVVRMSSSDNNYGKNGIEAVKTKYNWENDSKKLIELYTEMVKKK